MTNNPQGFKDDSSGSLATDPENDYRYDQYGNMTADQNKQITRIKYNHLNLPTEIAFTNDRLIRYTYDASGTKMKKVAVSPSSENVTLYRDGFQYSKRNNEALKLQFFPTAEGYVKAVYEGTSTSPRFQYVYNYTDHLGNIRLQYTKMDGLRILEEDSYYPFGLKHKEFNDIGQVEDRSYKYKYKYNGKELQEEFGLNVYDYGARNYDAALGRWFNVDPLARKYTSWSPYNYVLGNPIRYIDPDGRSVETDYIVLKKDKTDSKGNVVNKKGDFVRADPNDGSEKDKTDRILRSNSKGEIKRRNGKKRVLMNNIAKNIISEGLNFRDRSHVFKYGGINQPTFENVRDFLVNFTDKVNKKEIAGYGIMSKKRKQKAISTYLYKDNSSRESFSPAIYGGYHIALFHFHTHSYGYSEASDLDKESKETRIRLGQDIPTVIFYNDGGIIKSNEY